MKKITVKTDLLKKSVQKLGAAINQKTTVPVLLNLLCRAADDSITFTASDTEMTVIDKLEATVEEPADFLVSFHVLQSLLSVCKEDTIELQVYKTLVKITSGKDVFDCKYKGKLEEFPAIKMPTGKTELLFEKEFISNLVEAVTAISKDELRQGIARVCVDVHDDGFIIVGTDGIILYKVNVPAEIKKETQLLLSPRMVQALSKIDEDLDIKFNEKFFSFESNGTTVIITRPEFKYPNYAAIIPDAESNLIVDTMQLKEAFKKLNLSSESYKTADLILSKDSISATAKDDSFGTTIRVEFPCEFTGDSWELTLSTSCMLRLLGSIKSEKISLAVSGPTKAIVVRNPGDNNYLGLNAAKFFCQTLPN